MQTLTSNIALQPFEQYLVKGRLEEEAGGFEVKAKLEEMEKEKEASKSKIHLSRHWAISW